MNQARREQIRYVSNEQCPSISPLEMQEAQKRMIPPSAASGTLGIGWCDIQGSSKIQQGSAGTGRARPLSLNSVYNKSRETLAGFQETLGARHLNSYI